MNARPEFPHHLPTVFPPFSHPTPAHIRGCILDELCAEMTAREQYLDGWIFTAINRAIAKANAQHDAGAV